MKKQNTTLISQLSKILLSVALFFCLMPVFCSTIFADSTDYDQLDKNNATEITVTSDGAVLENQTTTSDAPYLLYKLTVNEAGTYRVHLTNDNPPQYPDFRAIYCAYVLDPDNMIPAKSQMIVSNYLDSMANNNAGNKEMVFTCSQQETIYLAIWGSSRIYDVPFTISIINTYGTYYEENGIIYKKNEATNDSGESVFEYSVVQCFINKTSNVTLLSEINGLPVTKISQSAFHGTYTISTLEIPGSIKSIDGMAFAESAFYNIILHEGVETLNSSAFSYCTIQNIQIPSTVTSKYQFFEACNVTNIQISEANPYLMMKENAMYSKDQKTLRYATTNVPSIYEIPEGTTEIAEYAFAYSSIQKVILPSTMVKLGECAFEHSSIEEIQFNEGLTTIGANCFEDADNIKYIEFPSTLKQIGRAAFINSNLSYVEIGSSVELIESDAFGIVGCIIVFREENPNLELGIITLDGIIWGHDDSKAHDMAKQNNITFNSLDFTNSCEHTDSVIDYKYQKKPTCQEEGIVCCKCIRCGAELETQSVSTTDHSFTGSDHCRWCNEPHQIISMTKSVPLNGQISTSTDTIFRFVPEESGTYYFACRSEQQRISFMFTNFSNIKSPYLLGMGDELTVFLKKGELLVISANNCIDPSVTVYASCMHTNTTTMLEPASMSTDGILITTCNCCHSPLFGKDIAKISSVTFAENTYTYDGTSKTPDVIVKDSRGDTLKINTDYTVSYPAARTNVGNYSVNVNFIGDYTGSQTLNYSITPKEVTPTVVLSATSYIYDGKDKKPSVTVKIGSTVLSAGNYTISYPSDLKSIGSKKITVTLKGNYKGSKTVTYNIVPGKVTGLKQWKSAYSSTKIKMSWVKVAGADSYSIYRSDSLNGTYKLLKSGNDTPFINSYLQSGRTYYYKIRAYKLNGTTKIYGDYSDAVKMITKPGAPAVTLTAASKSAKITWTASRGANGYEVYMCTKKDGTYTKIKTAGSSTLSYTKTGLKSGQKYYIKVRAYTTLGTEKVYSGWSQLKSVTAK